VHRHTGTAYQPLDAVLAARLVGDCLLRGPGAAPALDSDDLEVQGAEVHAMARPGVKVVGDGDGAAGAATAAD
jgi:hypothetical protein